MTKRILTGLAGVTMLVSVTVYWQWTTIMTLVHTTQMQAQTTITLSPPSGKDEATQQMLNEGAATIDAEGPARGHTLSLAK